MCRQRSLYLLLDFQSFMFIISGVGSSRLFTCVQLYTLLASCIFLLSTIFSREHLCFVQLCVCVYLISRRFSREHSTIIRGVYTHVLKLPCHVWDCCIDNLDHTKFVNNTKVINDSGKDPKSTGQGDRQSIQDPCVKVAEAVGRGPSGITNCLLPPTTNIQNRRQPNSMSCKSVRTLMLTDISKF